MFGLTFMTKLKSKAAAKLLGCVIVQIPYTKEINSFAWFQVTFTKKHDTLRVIITVC